MKILFLVESTEMSDSYLYLKAVVEALAADDYDCKIAFTTRGTPADHTYQLLKPYTVHHLTKLEFRSTDIGYTERLAGHVNRTQYDYIVVTQSVFPGTDTTPVTIPRLYSMLEHFPKLIFLGMQCSPSVTQAAKDVANLEPAWAAVSQNVATRFMADYDVQVIYGPALRPGGDGTDIRKEFGIRPETKVIGYMGNVDVVNWEPVLEAVRRMNVLLLMAGTGDRLPYLSGSHVKVVPTIPQQQRADWFKAFDCFIYPVTGSGFPMLCLEAAMCNCPVAMTPVSDAYQLLQGRFGFFSFRVEEIVKSIQESVRVNADQNRIEIGEQFSQEKFLSGWHVLLG